MNTFMKKKKVYVVSRNNRWSYFSPTNLIIVWLLMDRFNAPQLALGAYWTLACLFVILYIIERLSTKEIEVDITKILEEEYKWQMGIGEGWKFGTASKFREEYEKIMKNNQQDK